VPGLVSNPDIINNIWITTRIIFRKKRCTTKHKYYILLRTVFHWNNLNILVL
jgi:hypothetical protein